MTANRHKADKQVLAVQCFLDTKQKDDIDHTCKQVANRLCDDFGTGYSNYPHITLASYLVTPEELQEAQSVFSDRLRHMQAITVSTHLGTKHQEDHPDRLFYFLYPDMTQALIQFHARAHEQLAYPYEPYRQIDLPGNWWPHLTLFNIPKEKKEVIQDELNVLEDIHQVTITRLGLVTFHPTTTVCEVYLAVPK